MMTLEKWADSALLGLDDMVASLPESFERDDISDLLHSVREKLEELVSLETEEEG